LLANFIKLRDGSSNAQTIRWLANSLCSTAMDDVQDAQVSREARMPEAVGGSAEIAGANFSHFLLSKKQLERMKNY